MIAPLMAPQNLPSHPPRIAPAAIVAKTMNVELLTTFPNEASIPPQIAAIVALTNERPRRVVNGWYRMGTPSRSESRRKEIAVPMP
jgi:hypothetical protein